MTKKAKCVMYIEGSLKERKYQALFESLKTLIGPFNREPKLSCQGPSGYSDNPFYQLLYI